MTEYRGGRGLNICDLRDWVETKVDYSLEDLPMGKRGGATEVQHLNPKIQKSIEHLKEGYNQSHL